VIIVGSWIFSFIVVTPTILSVNVKDNACVSMVEEWMSKAYYLLWSAIVVVAMAIMVGLYSRIVYTLWFKRNPDNQLTFQQRVSINTLVENGDIFLSINLRKWTERKFNHFFPSDVMVFRKMGLNMSREFILPFP